MQTMDSALLELYQKGEITYDTAVAHAHDPRYIRHQAGDSETG
jgi:twitching motility protein PilT